MKNLKNKIREWLDRRQQINFEKRFQTMMEKKDSWQFKAVQQYALAQARLLVRNWLINHRIAFCVKCEETGTLRKVDGHWLCNKCFKGESKLAVA